MEETNRLELVKTITNIHDENFIRRLETLSKQLSTKNPEFSISPDDFDLQHILSLFTQLASNQGIHLRQAGVTFKDIHVRGVDETFSVAPTVLDMLKGPVGAIMNARSKKKIPDRIILNNINGYAEAGEMVLVLGRP